MENHLGIKTTIDNKLMVVNENQEKGELFVESLGKQTQDIKYRPKERL